MIIDREKFDWQTREDAETLQRAQAIKSDPARLKKAQECIIASIDEGKAALKGSPVGSRKRNKATISGVNLNNIKR